jgi:hypothetical protein
MNVKNKYCFTCAHAAARNDTPKDHKCYKNFEANESSAKMESAIISEGFSQSVELYGMKYNKLIGDGDSSVHKKVEYIYIC